jgi:purine-binding chemotaxis protein CheW
VKGFLLVRSNGRGYGLPLEDVIEVADDLKWTPMPETRPSVRGVVTVRGTMMPLVSLNALLREEPLAEETGRTAVVASRDGRTVALEVDDAEEVIRDSGLPVPPGRNMPWALGIAEKEDELVPIVDLRVLGWRLGQGSGQVGT